jgi:hypothetical protein
MRWKCKKIIFSWKNTLLQAAVAVGVADTAAASVELDVSFLFFFFLGGGEFRWSFCWNGLVEVEKSQQTLQETTSKLMEAQQKEMDLLQEKQQEHMN